MLSFLDSFAEFATSHLDHCGGESFIQLITGINLAFFTFEQFDSRRRLTESFARKKYLATVASIYDRGGHTGGRTAEFLLGWAAPKFGTLHDRILQGVRWSALVFGLVGVVSLYVGGRCGYSWILAIPAMGYYALTLCGFALFWTLCAGLKWICGKRQRPADTNEAAIRSCVAEARRVLTAPPISQVAKSRPLPPGTISMAESAGKAQMLIRWARISYPNRSPSFLEGVVRDAVARHPGASSVVLRQVIKARVDATL